MKAVFRVIVGFTLVAGTLSLLISGFASFVQWEPWHVFMDTDGATAWRLFIVVAALLGALEVGEKVL